MHLTTKAVSFELYYGNQVKIWNSYFFWQGPFNLAKDNPDLYNLQINKKKTKFKSFHPFGSYDAIDRQTRQTNNTAVFASGVKKINTYRVCCLEIDRGSQPATTATIQCTQQSQLVDYFGATKPHNIKVAPTRSRAISNRIYRLYLQIITSL